MNVLYQISKYTLSNIASYFAQHSLHKIMIILQYIVTLDLIIHYTINTP